MKVWPKPQDVLLDQYYTCQQVARKLYGVFQEYFDPNQYQLVEPSAGTGSFFRLMPHGSLAFDVDPKYPGIRTADFLCVEIRSEREVAVVGNPPFGRNASMAVRFFNHAAWQASVIALILPRTFRKASIENRLDRNFHLGRVDKRDSQTGRVLIQSCFLRSSHGSRGFVGSGMGRDRTAVAV